MTREELLLLVNGKVDTTKFKSLSQRAINEELDDVLEDFGDDEEANDKIVTKLANRLKRMDGNVHKGVSDEMKKNKDAEEERKRKEEEERREREKNRPNEDEDPKIKALNDKLDKLLAANEARDKKAARDATIESVKRGLRDKFDKADLEMNDFFLDTALSKLEIPDEDANVVDLVSKAEGIYTADYKRANGGNAIPRKANSNSRFEETKIDEHEWDDIKEAFKDNTARGNVK